MSVVAVISHCKFHILDRCSLSSGCAVWIGARAMSGHAVHIHVYTHDVKAGVEEKAGVTTRVPTPPSEPPPPTRVPTPPAGPPPPTRGPKPPSGPPPPELLPGHRVPHQPSTPPPQDLLAGYRLPVRPPTPPAPVRLPIHPMAQLARVVKPPKFAQHTPRVVPPRRAPEVVPWKYGKVPVSVPPRRILTGEQAHTHALMMARVKEEADKVKTEEEVKIEAKEEQAEATRVPQVLSGKVIDSLKWSASTTGSASSSSSSAGRKRPWSAVADDATDDASEIARIESEIQELERSVDAAEDEVEVAISDPYSAIGES